MHSIRYTELAEADLYVIFEKIYADKPMAAIRYIDGFDAFIRLLEENPLMGIECKRKQIDKDCRVLVYEDYLIFYAVKQTEVILLRILHAHYNYKETLI